MPETQEAPVKPDGSQAKEFSYCTQPEVPPIELGPEVNGERARLIRLLRTKWANGTTLRYYFFDRDTDGEWVTLRDGSREWRTWTGKDSQKAIVRDGFKTWKDVGIGVTFKEVSDRSQAEIRIGFQKGAGAWSYLGRDILGQGRDDRTMNLGWDELDTAVHEIGHTLGFPHEHQNPNAGIVWDEEEVYRRLAGPPNRWDRQKTFWNIIRKIAADEVQGSSWDPDSIMHYPFGEGMIQEPAQYRTGLSPAPGLSNRDQAWVKSFYPALEKGTELKPFKLEKLEIEAGEQVNFTIEPAETRNYQIATFGDSDTVMVLFEDQNGELRYVSADDDSGKDYNANLKLKLFQGRKYVLRLRLYYAHRRGETAVMLW